MPAQCNGCGIEAPEGAAGCQALFERLMARELSDPSTYAIHRMMVDAYCLQHPDAYCASAKSFAAHLTGLCCAIEYGGAPSVYGATRRALDGVPPIRKPALPGDRGALTIDHVFGAAGPEAYERALREWADS